MEDELAVLVFDVDPVQSEGLSCPSGAPRRR
jgi:hypothetical protein